ncbi:MAG TPA: squalene/phytoene synthase family protein [Stellaceae bacterium]|nr:squalene/phytoene synthase family protein [Stellaceae bacterium]
MAESQSLSSLAHVVRQHDRDRFLTALFAPEARRGELLALYAFNYEIAKTREVVSEPVLGQIRLQWWRETVESIYGGGPVHPHETVAPLAEAIRSRGLSRAHVDALIAARDLDLGGEAPESLAALEAYAESSSARLVWLALEVLGERGANAIAAGRAVGIAYALSGLLRALPFHARAKRLYLPRDLCAAAGLRIDQEVFELRPSPALARVVAQVATAAAGHLAAARAQQGAVPRAALPALLPAVLAGADLARLKRAGYDPFDRRLARQDPWRGWRLTLAALRRRY